MAPPPRVSIRGPWRWALWAEPAQEELQMLFPALFSLPNRIGLRRKRRAKFARFKDLPRHEGRHSRRLRPPELRARGHQTGGRANLASSIGVFCALSSFQIASPQPGQDVRHPFKGLGVFLSFPCDSRRACMGSPARGGPTLGGKGLDTERRAPSRRFSRPARPRPTRSSRR